MIRVQGDCPLGSKCEEHDTRFINGKDEQVLVVCPWYVEMKGKDAMGDDHDEWRCAIAWSPILQVEMAGTNRHVSAAVESLRNETVKRQDAALKAVKEASSMKVIEGS